MFFKITDAATKISKQKETMRDDQADQKVKYMQFVQMKNAPIEIKNSADGLNSRSDIAEERISKLKDKSEETAQNEVQEDKEIGNINETL